MTRIILIIILFFSFLTSQAQQKYSMEYFEKLSQEELSSCLTKSLKLQKTGRTLNIVGVSTFGVSTVCLFATANALGMAALLFVLPAMAGIVILAAGIPINLTGKKRVERINTIQQLSFSGITIDLKPIEPYNLVLQKYTPGITLRIRF